MANKEERLRTHLSTANSLVKARTLTAVLVFVLFCSANMLAADTRDKAAKPGDTAYGEPGVSYSSDPVCQNEVDNLCRPDWDVASVEGMIDCGCKPREEDTQNATNVSEVAAKGVDSSPDKESTVAEVGSDQEEAKLDTCKPVARDVWRINPADIARIAKNVAPSIGAEPPTNDPTLSGSPSIPYEDQNIPLPTSNWTYLTLTLTFGDDFQRSHSPEKLKTIAQHFANVNSLVLLSKSSARRKEKSNGTGSDQGYRPCTRAPCFRFSN